MPLLRMRKHFQEAPKHISLAFYWTGLPHILMPKPIRGNRTYYHDWLKPIKSQPSLNHIAKWNRVIPESKQVLLGQREEKGCCVGSQKFMLKYPRA